jgi:hypothetical protein
MRPAWPTGLTLDNAVFMFRGEPETVELDVAAWGDISGNF